jgi:hypothetical protein
MKLGMKPAIAKEDYLGMKPADRAAMDEKQVMLEGEQEMPQMQDVMAMMDEMQALMDKTRGIMTQMMGSAQGE